MQLLPKIGNLLSIGNFIKEGIKLIGARAVYDFPKIFILVAIGYDHIGLIVDWIDYLITYLSGDSIPKFTDKLEESTINFSTTLGIELGFFFLFSLIVTPAYKILELKYSVKMIKYIDFFSLAELKKSFGLYYKYNITTIGMYFWDVLLSVLSVVVGIILLMLFPLLLPFVHPIYKLLFCHFPKSYGYGLLARRMYLNGDLIPADSILSKNN